MSVHIERLLSSNRVLLLQGPLGKFFSHFAHWLIDKNIQCYKVNFNGGDEFYSKDIAYTFAYTDAPENFAEWVNKFILNHDIDAVVCFGDCRYYHQIAKKIAHQIGIKFFAFEEGYIRPNYVTFEEDGVNFYSNFWAHIQEKNDVKVVDEHHEVKEVSPSFGSMVRAAIFYYFFMLLGSLKYSKYRHHRMLNVWQEILFWTISAIRRMKNRIFEVAEFDQFIQAYSQKYFVFALQVHNDFQIRTHSELGCVRKYIDVVIRDFAKNANAKHHLVLKHHPMDRGYRHYGCEIRNLAKAYGVEGRVHYFCDIHLPTLIKNCIGFITINSTTGIQALYHGVPVKVLGNALYDFPKLTHNYSLEKFWLNPRPVDMEFFKKFRSELIQYSQLNGSFYGDSPWMRQRKSYRKGNIRRKKIDQLLIRM